MPNAGSFTRIKNVTRFVRQMKACAEVCARPMTYSVLYKILAAGNGKGYGVFFDILRWFSDEGTCITVLIIYEAVCEGCFPYVLHGLHRINEHEERE